MPLGRGGSRSRKCRPSVIHCAERYACPTQPAVAAFYCDQCQTNQCQSCEFHLHKVEKNGRHLFEFHDRHALVPTSADQICEQFKGGGCDPRNVADVVCSSCNQRRYCFDCDTKVHRGRQMSSHRRAPLSLADFQPPPPLKGLNELVERLSPPPTFDCASGAVCPPGSDSGASLRNSFDGEDGGDLFESLPPTENFSEHRHPNLASVSSFVKTNGTSSKSDMFRAAGVAAVLPNNDASDYKSSVEFVSNPSPVSSMMVSTAATTNLPKSFVLFDKNGRLMINTVEDFQRRLHCQTNNAPVHTVSVLGAIGCGKSYLLNHAFFGGVNVFHTKPTSDGSSVLSGIHAAFDSTRNVVLLDVEAASDVGDDHSARNLLKMVFSASDIVIIYAKTERLRENIFRFLSPDVEEFSSTSCSTATNVEKSEPAVIVFHETQFSDVLSDDDGKHLLEQQLSDLGLPKSTVGCVHYVGTRTTQLPSDFRSLLSTVEKLLSDGATRIARRPLDLYAELQAISDSFTKDVVDNNMLTDAAKEEPSVKACSSKCLCCSTCCVLPATHCDVGAPHSADRHQPCKYAEQFDNRVLLCQGCWKKGKEVVLQRKSWESTDSSWYSRAVSVWTGYALECVNCGIVHRGTDSWFGNTGTGAGSNVSDAEKSSAVRTAVRHVWPEDVETSSSLQSTAAGSATFFTARHVIDKVSSVSEALVGFGAEPTKKVTNWITDRIAPSNWVPNWKLTNCHSCGVAFDSSTPIHHCRCCGQGFCDRCSSRRKPLPELNWGTSPVRVCDKCFDKSTPEGAPAGSENGTAVPANDIIPRFVGEAIGSTVGAFASVVKVTLLDAARPANWIPDEEITECVVCSTPFSAACRLHHCRACGHGVCDSCSPHRRPVPTHGWHEPVRVCTRCLDAVDESS